MGRLRGYLPYCTAIQPGTASELHGYGCVMGYIGRFMSELQRLRVKARDRSVTVQFPSRASVTILVNSWYELLLVLQAAHG